jgi:hypothetical protein
MPRLLSLAAPCNNSGKTRLLATVLASWPGRFTAMKVSTVYGDGANCPRAANACACRELKGDYTILTSPALVQQPGTDTGLFTTAGARRTIWCLARPGAHDDLWSQLQTEVLDSDELLVTEGNKIVKAASPEALVVVADPDTSRSKWKDDTWDLMARANLIVLNQRADSRDAGAVEALADEIMPRVTCPVIAEDVTKPLDSWSRKEMMAIVRKLGEPAGMKGEDHRAAGFEPDGDNR